MGGGSADQSRQSRPAITSSIIAASVTVRVCGPACDSVPYGLDGYIGTSPYVALRATVPVKDAGIRTEPPPSVPIDQVPMPSPTAVADPPLEPPEVRPAPHGLPVTPCRMESVTPFQANSGVVVLPRKTVPASRSRAVAGPSSFQSASASMRLLPRTVGQPFVRNMSLIDTGTPSAGPSGSPAA